MRKYLQEKSKALGNKWRVFFDKKRGKDIDIEVFPFLFIMQIHNGVAGIVFASAWFAVLSYWYSEFWNFGTMLAATLIEGGFGIIIVASAIVLGPVVI